MRKKNSSKSNDGRRPKRETEPGIKNPYVRYHKLKKPKVTLQQTTLWDYPSQHYGTQQQGSQGYRGATPSYVIWNVLQRYTKEKDTILDPFCGSGTTLDVCTDLNREGIGFDISPFRADIRPGDARSLPLKANSVDHIFLDPPYADNLTYSDDPQCIGRTNAGDGSWQTAMDDVFTEMHRVVRPGGLIAVLVSDVMHKKWGFQPLGSELIVLGQRRWELVDHVIVMRHGRKVETDLARGTGTKKGHMQRGFSHLMLFRAPKGKHTQPFIGQVARKGKERRPSGPAKRTSASRPTKGRTSTESSRSTSPKRSDGQTKRSSPGARKSAARKKTQEAGTGRKTRQTSSSGGSRATSKSRSPSKGRSPSKKRGKK